MYTIKIVDRTDPLATQAKQLVFEHAVASWAILFDGERWYHVERVAVALQDGNPVGMASLCPHGELNEPGEGPQIIGVWVHPELRGGGIGTALVHALAEESQRLYQQVPKMLLPHSPAMHWQSVSRGAVWMLRLWILVDLANYRSIAERGSKNI